MAGGFELHLCGTCTGLDRVLAGAAETPPPLAAALMSAVAAAPWGGQVALRRFACLGACRSRGRVSIAQPGRWGVAFGGLAADEVAPLCAFITLWLAHPAGQVPKALRPAPIHDRIIARLPPPGSAEGTPVPLTGGAR